MCVDGRPCASYQYLLTAFSDMEKVKELFLRIMTSEVLFQSSPTVVPSEWQRGSKAPCKPMSADKMKLSVGEVCEKRASHACKIRCDQQDPAALMHLVQTQQCALC